MKIWEAIIYGIFGGLAELLPISFQGHYAFLRGAFNLAPLTEGGGCYVRAALCLGIMAAVILSFSSELRAVGEDLLRRSAQGKRRRGQRRDGLLRRSFLLCVFALLPMLCSFFFLAKAERVLRLPFVALFFLLNGVILHLPGRNGSRTEETATVLDSLLIGLSRMLCVFPGLSSLGASITVGQGRGLSQEYNLRLTYVLTFLFEFVAFFYYLIRAFIFGSFSAAIFLSMLLAAVFATVFGYLAIQYMRYLLRNGKMNLLSYYCWTMVPVLLLLSLINA